MGAFLKNSDWTETSKFTKGSENKKAQAPEKKPENIGMTQINSKEPQHNNFKQNKGMGAFKKNSDSKETSKLRKGSKNKKAQAQEKKGGKRWNVMN
jgi:hypothetical protein